MKKLHIERQRYGMLKKLLNLESGKILNISYYENDKKIRKVFRADRIKEKSSQKCKNCGKNFGYFRFKDKKWVCRQCGVVK